MTTRELGLTPDAIALFRFCQVELFWDWQRVITRFPDGSEAHGAPHDTPEYHAHSVEKTGQDDIMLYAVEHDLTHVLIGEAQGKPSSVLWALAHNQPTNGEMFKLEEEAAQSLHKFLTAAKWPQRCEEIRNAAKWGGMLFNQQVPEIPKRPRLDHLCY